MRVFLKTIWAVILEISDESAYQRYLRFHGRIHCAEEWRRFCDQRFTRKYARAKCC